MIATISPEAQFTDESVSTCHFAQRVALVKNSASVNEEVEPELVIQRLRAEVRLQCRSLHLKLPNIPKFRRPEERATTLRLLPELQRVKRVLPKQSPYLRAERVGARHGAEHQRSSPARHTPGTYRALDGWGHARAHVERAIVRVPSRSRAVAKHTTRTLDEKLGHARVLHAEPAASTETYQVKFGEVS